MVNRPLCAIDSTCAAVFRALGDYGVMGLYWLGVPLFVLYVMLQITIGRVLSIKGHQMNGSYFRIMFSLGVSDFFVASMTPAYMWTVFTETDGIIRTVYLWMMRGGQRRMDEEGTIWNREVYLNPPFAAFAFASVSATRLLSILHLVVIAVNRYTAIMMPMKHEMIWHGKKIKIALFFCYAIVLLWCAPMALGWVPTQMGIYPNETAQFGNRVYIQIAHPSDGVKLTVYMTAPMFIFVPVLFFIYVMLVLKAREKQTIVGLALVSVLLLEMLYTAFSRVLFIVSQVYVNASIHAFVFPLLGTIYIYSNAVIVLVMAKGVRREFFKTFPIFFPAKQTAGNSSVQTNNK